MKRLDISWGKSVRQKMNNLSVKKKMMITFGIVVILPILFVGIFLTTRMKAMALEQSMDELHAEVDRVSNQVNDLVSFVMTLQNEAIAEPKLFDIIHRDYHTTYEIVEDYRDFTRFLDYESTYGSIADMRIYVDNQSLLNNMDFMVADEGVKDSWWFKQAMVNEGQHLAWFHRDTIKQKDYLMVTKGFTTSKGVQAVMMTLIDLNSLGNILKDEVHDVYILDQAGYILANNERIVVGQTLYDHLGLYVINKDEEWRDFVFGEKSQLIKKELNFSSLRQPLYVFATIPLNQVLASANDASRLGMTIIIISIIGTIILIYLSSDLLTRRLNKLITDMGHVAKGNFQHVEVYDSKDEFGLVSKHLFDMSQSLETLIEENTFMHQKERDYMLAREQMKFDVLSSQVNPHFLFNVLESIRMKAFVSGEREIAEVVKLLGQSFRRNLEISSDLVSLQEEVEFVEHYFKIQKFRFEERIDYMIAVDPMCYDYNILPMLIQPIIENAFVHGLESAQAGGRIELHVKAVDDRIRIEIIDNGVGIGDRILAQFNKGFIEHSKKGRRHIGLNNIAQRIEYYYKGEGSMTISRPEVGGTQVTMLVPLMEVEDENTSC